MRDRTTTHSREPKALFSREKLVDAYCRMDIRAFEKLLEEDLQWYGQKNKYDLIAHIKKQFDNLKATGNTELIPVFGRCVGCKEDATGYRFIGNKTKHSITYIISEDEHVALDISYCNFFHVAGEPMPDTSLPF